MSDVDVNENLGGDEAARDIGNNPIEYTETITTGFGERLQASCWGILFGIILFIGSFPFLYWNEGRAVDRYEALNEAEGETITVSGLNIDPLNDGKVLHFSVNITNGGDGDATLVDPIFGIQASSSDNLILHRDTEMYQWVEKVSTTSKKNVGGSKTTTKNYSYVKEWKNRLINSGSFKKQSNQHVNPSFMEFESTEIIANPIRIGAYDLPSSLVGRLTWDRPLRDVTVNDISNVELRNRAVQSGGGQFYFATNTKVSSFGTATTQSSQNISPPPSVSPISITSPVENSIATRPPLPSRPVLGTTTGSAGCTDTPNYLDTWGGSCADYELPGNEDWCAGYGSTGEQGKTPNENCCVCKALLSGDEEEIVLGGLRGRRVQQNSPAQIPQSSDITTSSGPQIGDQRVSFSEVPASVITIVGVQNGNTLSAFVSDSGEGGDILLFKQGSYSSVEMYDEAEASNAAATWILRFVGFIAMALGMVHIFRPIEVFADVVPCVGSIIGCGIIFMSVLLAGILSTITISIAWLAAQPKIGAIVLACLLIVVGSCAFGFKKIKGKQNADDHDDDDFKLETKKDEELEVVANAVPTVEAIPEQEITVATVERTNEPPKPYVP